MCIGKGRQDNELSARGDRPIIEVRGEVASSICRRVEGRKTRYSPRLKAMKRSLLGLILTLSAGCYSTKKEPEVWTPKPRVEWTHLAAPAPALVQNGYSILTGGRTKGLFPANMGVTRVSLASGEEESSATEPRLYADPRNEFLQWNTAFDDQMAVSEVFPIAQRDLGGREADPAQILAAFRGLHARLGLLYAVNELSETETEMFGTLYDTTTGAPVAVIHSRAASIAPDPNDEKARDKKRPDLWKTDSRALVRAKFADHVHTCIRDLIAADEPALVEAPTGWTPAGPIRPVEWPPRHLRTAP